MSVRFVSDASFVHHGFLAVFEGFVPSNRKLSPQKVLMEPVSEALQGPEPQMLETLVFSV